MPELLSFLLCLLGGAAIGAAFIYLLLKNARKQQEHELERLQQQVTEHSNQEQLLNESQERYTALDREHAISEERLQHIQAQHDEKNTKLEQAQTEINTLKQQLADQQSAFASLRTKMDEDLKNNEEKQNFFKESIDQLQKQFKATASELLVDTGEKITKQQSEKLGDMMKPFRENLSRFEKEFKSAYDKEAREQISLKEHIKHLGSLNNKLSDEAHALSQALKGDSKVRGNWGEQMLEHILQSSGLRKDHEYSTQESFTGEEGNRLQPDVIINLPDDKCIIVDSKVTLNSWMDFVNADTEELRTQHIKAFSNAVQFHVKSLSEKNYHKIYDIHTLDFVLMFIPIETAFLYALQEDGSLYDNAHKQNIILVSPTTLMAVLKTIAVNWKYDRQEKNTLLIAKEAEKLLDKIHNYAEDLVKARNSLQATDKHFERAYKRFATGKGNIKDSTDKLRRLGVKSAKKMGIEWEQIEEEEADEDIQDSDTIGLEQE